MQLRNRINLFDKAGLDKNTVATLRLMIISVMGGVVFGNVTGGIAMTGYLKELSASDFLYGVIFALAPIASAFQFFASYRMEKTLKRKRMLIISGFIQRLIWVPFALIPFIIPMSHAQYRLWAAVVCVAISACAAPFLSVTFYSICSDVVPLRIRGRYFAVRSRVSTFAGLIVGLLIGLLLDRMPGFPGYCLVFVIAGICGAFDILCYIYMPLPEMKKTSETGSMGVMVRQVVKDRHYMFLVFGMTCWSFSVQLASPYFNVYMRDVMMMTNLDIMLFGQITANIFLILFVPRWGRAMDSFGNRPVLCVAAFLTSFMPMIFTAVGSGMLWLVFIANALGGATYCAIDLSAQNLFIGQAQGENKSMYFAVYFIFTQLFGLALGSSVGGYLLDNVLCYAENVKITLFSTALTRYNYLFFISSLLRILTVVFFLRHIYETDAQSSKNMILSLARSTQQRAAVLQATFAHRRARKLLKKGD